MYVFNTNEFNDVMTLLNTVDLPLERVEALCDDVAHRHVTTVREKGKSRVMQFKHAHTVSVYSVADVKSSLAVKLFCYCVERIGAQCYNSHKQYNNKITVTFKQLKEAGISPKYKDRVEQACEVLNSLNLCFYARDDLTLVKSAKRLLTVRLRRGSLTIEIEQAQADDFDFWKCLTYHFVESGLSLYSLNNRMMLMMMMVLRQSQRYKNKPQFTVSLEMLERDLAISDVNPWRINGKIKEWCDRLNEWQDDFQLDFNGSFLKAQLNLKITQNGMNFTQNGMNFTQNGMGKNEMSAPFFGSTKPKISVF